MDQLDLEQERIEARARLPELTDETIYHEIFECENSCMDEIEKCFCRCCERERLNHLLNGINAQGQLLMCFNDPEQARDRRLLHGLLYMKRGSAVPLVL